MGDSCSPSLCLGNRCLHAGSAFSFYLNLCMKLSKLQECVTTPRPQDWAHWFLVPPPFFFFFFFFLFYLILMYDKWEASPVQTSSYLRSHRTETWWVWNESEQQTFSAPLTSRYVCSHICLTLIWHVRSGFRFGV